jgi:hypothetical protein
MSGRLSGLQTKLIREKGMIRKRDCSLHLFRLKFDASRRGKN